MFGKFFSNKSTHKDQGSHQNIANSSSDDLTDTEIKQVITETLKVISLQFSPREFYLLVHIFI